jgi:hypothetical protein
MTAFETTQQTTRPASPSARTFLALSLILPIFALAPLFYPGYFQTHAGLIPVWNVAELRTAPQGWGWTPHVALQFDPLRSDGLLPYYLAAILPVGPATAVKVVVGLAWLLGSAGMYLWLKGWLGYHGALAAALVYTYLPFQIATVYVRGAWGEALFWGLLPWAILGSTFLVTSPRLLIFPVAAFLWSMLAFTQLGLALWAALFVVLLLLAIHLRQSLLPVISVLLGPAAASIFYTANAVSLTVPTVNFADHFLYPFQLLSAFWGYGASRPGWNDGLSFQLGLAAVGLTIVAVALWQQTRSLTSQMARTDRRLIFFLSAAVVLTLLPLGLVVFIWNLPLWPGYSLAATLTYPWQLLGLAGLCLAVLAGATLWLDSRLTGLPLFGAILLFVLLSSYPYLNPRFIQVGQFLDGPEALLGETQLALIDHNLAVSISNHSAGLPPADAALPLVVYGPPQPNDQLLLNVVWQPLHPFDRDFKVFVHLVDSGGRVLAQFDGHPQGGDYPTSRWIPGELIEDTYPVLLPAELPPGPYRLFVGLYDEATMTRLPVSTDSEGRVILNVE